MQEGAVPRGIVARLRHQAGPLLPKFLRRAGARVLDTLEGSRGSTYEIGGHRLRFIKGSAPPVLAVNADERSAVDALQLASFARAIRPGDVIADVGSYHGTYAVVAAAVAGAGGKVCAFEPTSSNRDVIAANVALNGYGDRVVVEDAAVSDHTGMAQFFVWGDATTNSLAATRTEAAATDVRTVTLDDYFANRRPPDVVKIDIEGAELLALRGAQTILAAGTRILCELHPYAWSDLGYSADNLRAFLNRFDRVTVDLATGAELSEYRYGAVWLEPRG